VPNEKEKWAWSREKNVMNRAVMSNLKLISLHRKAAHGILTGFVRSLGVRDVPAVTKATRLPLPFSEVAPITLDLGD